MHGDSARLNRKLVDAITTTVGSGLIRRRVVVKFPVLGGSALRVPSLSCQARLCFSSNSPGCCRLGPPSQIPGKTLDVLLHTRLRWGWNNQRGRSLATISLGSLHRLNNRQRVSLKHLEPSPQRETS